MFMLRFIWLGLFVLGCEKSFSSDKVSNFQFKTIDNKVLDLSQFYGKVIIVDFWATWCPPCTKEIPHFIELQEKYKNEVQFIGLNVGEKESQIKEFVKSMGINYIIGYSNDNIEKLFGGINGLPTTFIIGKDGKVKAKAIGYRSKEWFENQIISALRES
ncbi:MAG: TlpA disulfide reductase family protein [candidate division WOR-3 bacterium]